MAAKSPSGQGQMRWGCPCVFPMCSGAAVPMAPWTADSGLLAGVDHLVGFCIRLWEFGTQLATLYSLTPRYAALLGCPAMALDQAVTCRDSVNVV